MFYLLPQDEVPWKGSGSRGEIEKEEGQWGQWGIRVVGTEDLAYFCCPCQVAVLFLAFFSV